MVVPSISCGAVKARLRLKNLVCRPQVSPTAALKINFYGIGLPLPKILREEGPSTMIKRNWAGLRWNNLIRIRLYVLCKVVLGLLNSARSYRMLCEPCCSRAKHLSSNPDDRRYPNRYDNAG